MAANVLSVALAVAMQVGGPAPSETPNYPALQNAFSQHGFEGQFEQRYPFDTQQNWVHGYFQEIPAYGGHAFFRPYNYKDVMSQSQTAAGWGMSPQLPYSQQFWHRYHDRATMLKLSGQPAENGAGMAAATQPSTVDHVIPVTGYASQHPAVIPAYAQPGVPVGASLPTFQSQHYAAQPFPAQPYYGAVTSPTAPQPNLPYYQPGVVTYPVHPQAYPQMSSPQMSYPQPSFPQASYPQTAPPTYYVPDATMGTYGVSNGVAPMASGPALTYPQ